MQSAVYIRTFPEILEHPTHILEVHDSLLEHRTNLFRKPAHLIIKTSQLHIRKCGMQLILELPPRY